MVLQEYTLHYLDEGKIEVDFVEPLSEGEEYCLNYLETAGYLWDMRAWDKHKDLDEVLEWIQSFRDGDGSHKNDGHAGYCIEQLISMGKTNEDIAIPIMENKNIQYKYRLVTCMKGVRCKHWTEDEGYRDCPCERCEKPQQTKIKE